jgi:hypothetical protein
MTVSFSYEEDLWYCRAEVGSNGEDNHDERLQRSSKKRPSSGQCGVGREGMEAERREERHKARGRVRRRGRTSRHVPRRGRKATNHGEKSVASTPGGGQGEGVARKPSI